MGLKSDGSCRTTYQTSSLWYERLCQLPTTDKPSNVLRWKACPLSKEVTRMPSVVSVSSALPRSRHFILKNDLLPNLDLKKTYYVLNPDRDLMQTQRRLLPVFQQHNFKGVVEEFPSRKDANKALVNKDMFIFDGHGIGLAHFTDRIIKEVDRCPAMLLTACCRALELKGCYMPGSAVKYILAGSPAVASYLWILGVDDSDDIQAYDQDLDT